MYSSKIFDYLKHLERFCSFWWRSVKWYRVLIREVTNVVRIHGPSGQMPGELMKMSKHFIRDIRSPP